MRSNINDYLSKMWNKNNIFLLITFEKVPQTLQ